MYIKASHKLPISFIAAMVFSATSVNGKCVGNGPSSSALKKRLWLRGELRGQRMQREKRGRASFSSLESGLCQESLGHAVKTSFTVMC